MKIEIELDDRYIKALDELCIKTDLNRSQLMKTALGVYQMWYIGKLFEHMNKYCPDVGD